MILNSQRLMDEKKIYKYALSLPIIIPAICFFLTPHNLDSIPRPIGTILLAIAFSGIVGGIPYLILALSLLFWMRNKDESQIRKALLFSPLFLVVVFTICGFIYVFAIGNESAPDSAAWVYFMGFLMFSGYILIFGYSYVLLVFGLVRILRNRPSANPQM